MNKLIKSFRTLIGKDSEIGKDTLAERCTILASGICAAIGNGDLAERCNHLTVYTDDQMTVLCIKSERGRKIISEQMRLTGITAYNRLVAGIINGGVEVLSASVAPDKATAVPQLEGTSFVVEEKVRNTICILNFDNQEVRLTSGKYRIGRKSDTSPRERFVGLPESWVDVSRDQATILVKDGNWLIKANKVLPSMQLNENDILQIEKPVELTGRGEIKIGSNHIISYEIKEDVN